jgi:hypothetical protein
LADPQDTKLQQLQLKEIETQLASVEQRMQRLALLKKSIELKLIDPQDSQRFDQFLKKLATADTSNIESLRGYITGAADKFDELIYANKTFAKESESVLKSFVRTDRQFANIAGTFDTVNRSVIKMNMSLEEANELVDKYVEGVKEGLEEYLDLDAVQTSIEKNMHKISREQKGQIKNAFGLNSSYDTVSDSLSDINQQLKDVNTPIRKMIQFDIGAVGSIEQDLQQVKAGIGKESFTFEMPDIDGKIIKKQLDAGFVEPMLRGIVGGGEILAKNMSDRIDVLKKIIEKKSGETSEIVKAMIEDLEAKQMDPNAQILSPDMQGKVEAAWGRIQKKGNAALMDLIGGTVQSSQKLKLLTARLEVVNTEIDVMAEKREKLAKTFDMLDRSLDTSIESLQYATRNMMPNWLYQTLGLDSAFQDISKTASEGLAKAAARISQGASATEALSEFAGTFGSNLLKSLGTIALVTIAVTALWKMMTAAGESVKEISKEFGVSRAMAYDMYKGVLNLTAAIGNTELKQEDVLEVLKKHRDEYGLIMDLNNKANQEAIKFAGQLGKQYGIGAGEAYGFTQQLQQLGADQKASEEIAAVAAHASNLAGIPFNNVVKDLAESSEFVSTMFAGYPQKAVAAAVKIRAMGGSLKQVEKSMNKAFDMQSFMKGMTELTMMTQGVVDLSKYFQLAVSGADATTQFKELASQFDRMVDSGQANVYNMRQFSEVTGQSAEEMMRGHKIRKMDADLGKDNVELLSKYVDKLSEADVADAKSALKAAKKLSAAEKLDTIWSSIKDTLTEALLPVLEVISDLIVGLAPALKLFGIVLKAIGAVIKGIVAPFKVMYELLSGDLTSAGDTLKSTFGNITSLAGILTTTISVFAAVWSSKKLLGGLGFVWNKIGGIKGGLTDATKTASTFASTLKTGIKGAFEGFKSGGTLLDKFKKSAQGIFKGVSASSIDTAIPGQTTEGKDKSLLDKGIDKIKSLFGGKPEETADPLQGPADALSSAADELKSAAAELSNCVCNTGGNQRGRKGGRKGNQAGKRAGGNRPGRPPSNRPQRASRTKVPKINTPATPTTANIPQPTTTNMPKPKTGGNLLSKSKDMMKGFGGKALKFGKAIGPGALTAVAGMGLDYLGSKYQEDAMKTGDEGTMNKARAANVGSKALQWGGAGAMLGSIVPGLGTAVGGAIGGALGGAVGIWESYFSDDAKAQDAQLKQIRESNGLLTDISKLSESQIAQLKEAGYSEDIIKKLNEGSISMEDAIREQFADFKLSDDQLSVLANPKTTGEERDRIMQSALSVTPPSLAVGTDLVKSDGLAMLHRGEAIVPAKVAQGGFDTDKFNTDTNKIVPVKIVEGGFDDTQLKQQDGMIGKMLKSFGVFENLKPMTSEVDSKITKDVAPKTEILDTPQSIKPIQPALTEIKDSAEQNERYTSQITTPTQQPVRQATNQDPMLKQLLLAMQDVANRPVVVEIGGVELRSFNKKLKTLNAL